MDTTFKTLLEAYSDFHAQHPLKTKTEAGAMLQKDLVAFLRMAAIEGAGSATLMDDVLMLVARHLIATSMAAHGGRICTLCVLGNLQQFANAVQLEANAMLEAGSNENSKRLN